MKRGGKNVDHVAGWLVDFGIEGCNPQKPETREMLSLCQPNITVYLLAQCCSLIRGGKGEKTYFALHMPCPTFPVLAVINDL